MLRVESNALPMLKMILILELWYLILKEKYRISANSFHGNYPFWNLPLCTVTFRHSTYRCGNYSREETITRKVRPRLQVKASKVEVPLSPVAYTRSSVTIVCRPLGK